MESIWNIKKIQSILPHRYPFLFIDKVVEINKEKKSVICLKNVTINDYYFKGHFPGNPVMPGVIMIEAMAQASIILYATQKPDLAARKPIYYLGKVEAKFKNIVVPGDELLLEVEGVKMINTAGIVRSKARVGDNIAVEASMSFGVKFI